MIKIDNLSLFTQDGDNQQSQKRQQKQYDRLLTEATGRCRKEPFYGEDGHKRAALTEAITQLALLGNKARRLFKPKKCYICKVHFFELHHFYHQLCPTCAAENYQRRTMHVDLSGRVALVTGGRIKIGYEIALQLLRAGAEVLVTTRFAKDAVKRYAAEVDFEKWQDKLSIYALDLRQIPVVEQFTQMLLSQKPHIDILINNAAQTIRRPDSYYADLLAKEQLPLLQEQKGLLGTFNSGYDTNNGLLTPASRDQFPVNCQDEFGEQIDTRSNNSWQLRLDQIDPLEMIEIQLINVTAPFLLNSRLKPLMEQSPFYNRFIINVSAMEGQFNRKNKTCRHPHTNMAKAALNMMTRTSAQDYAKQRIFMTSVDTGWVTQENPFPIKRRCRANGMVPPLDTIDGAARVLSPIFDNLNATNPIYGVFLKDYKITSW